jgi:hypothetical protein
VVWRGNTMRCDGLRLRVGLAGQESEFHEPGLCEPELTLSFPSDKPTSGAGYTNRGHDGRSLQ